MNTVLFPESSTVDAIESSLIESQTKTQALQAATLHLDFSKTEYFDVPALLQIISVLTQRRRSGLETSMALPQKQNARDFLRVWEFGEAIEKATGVVLKEVFSENDVSCLSGDREHALLRYLVASKYEGSLQRLLSRKFFSILTFFAKRTPVNKRMALDESERWQQALIRAVLDRHLGHADDYVGSRIVYEACTNALRHPGAKIIQTASSFLVFGKSAAARSTGYLTISFWDDGSSMVETLRDAIKAGKTVQALRVPALYADYKVSVHRYSGAKDSEQTIRSDAVPDRHTPDELLLVATTFPGITRDALGLDRPPNPSLQRSKPEWDAPGMGLYVLLNTAVDIFGGRVTFRTKDLRLTVSRSEGNTNVRHKAKVTKYGNEFPQFLGNMVTIRLPIKIAKS